jgi:hypothetical protein
MHIEEQPYDDRHAPRREDGPMDRFAEVKPTDAWGKPLHEGYSQISPGIVQKEFEIVLEPGELLNEVMHGLFIKAEQIPGAISLFWREQGSVNGHPMVLVQGHPHRVARFEELWNKANTPLRDGWLVWESHDRQREVSRIRWIRSNPQHTPGPCGAYDCRTEKASRWALVYLVSGVRHEKPKTGVAVVYCESCAVPKGSSFVEEDE